MHNCDVRGPTMESTRLASDLRSKRETLESYARSKSAQVLLVASFLLALARMSVGGAGRGDFVVLVVTVLMTGTVEWVIHRFLFHAAPGSWTSRRLGTGTRHREHHLDPTAIDSLMLRGRDGVVFLVVLGVVTALWSVPLLRFCGTALLGPFLMGWMLAVVGLAHYEWVHLLVHTRYRPTSRRYQALARHHRLHHFRNENYWFGVTSTSGDVLMRTRPQRPSDVPISQTALTVETRAAT